VSAEQLGLRERKKLRTRQALEAAAYHLFDAKGYDHTTVDDIAAEAEVSPRTFFRYFRTKDDVLLRHYDELRLGIARVLGEQPANAPVLVAVRQTIVDFARTLVANREVIALHHRLVESSPSLAGRTREHQLAMEGLITAWVTQRLELHDPADLRPALVGAAMVNALIVPLTAWVNQQRDDDELVPMVQHAIDLLDCDFGLPDHA
jgi:AcrR family transcriptional regulator